MTRTQTGILIGGAGSIIIWLIVIACLAGCAGPTYLEQERATCRAKGGVPSDYHKGLSLTQTDGVRCDGKVNR